MNFSYYNELKLHCKNENSCDASYFVMGAMLSNSICGLFICNDCFNEWYLMSKSMF